MGKCLPVALDDLGQLNIIHHINAHAQIIINIIHHINAHAQIIINTCIIIVALTKKLHLRYEFKFFTF